ncbi:MAG: hypothetical protein APR63_06505 [Desulfuromonas sp. SDB]|nr:MAG: hypothetical protein APR63_06505 [Desulfuromonas sp. SDB]
MAESIKNRNEFLFLYDIKNGNPNGDPDENRPRIDEVSKRCYVTDVRLKRFIRDYLMQIDGEDAILVTKVNRKTVNLTERVKQRLIKDQIDDTKQKKISGADLLNKLLDCFVDLKMFGSPLAFKDAPDSWGDTGTLTGPIQINFGETLHQVEETTFHGTTIFGSKKELKQGTFTTYYAIPYGLIAFHAVANENAAKTTKLGQHDMDKFKVALWKSVRESVTANTRTKKEQQPRLLLNIVYKEKIRLEGEERLVPTEYHIGSLEEKIRLNSKVGEQINIRKVGDYTLDPTELYIAISKVKDKIEKIEYCLSPEFYGIFEIDNNKIDFVKKLRELAKKNNKESYFEVENLDIDMLSVVT